MNPNQNAGTLTIKDKSTDTVKLSKDLISDGETKGFHLAGVDIPYPKKGGTNAPVVQKTGSEGLADDAGLCWVQRCTKAGEVAWVLSLVNGVDPNNPNSKCPKKSSIACGGSGTGEGEEPSSNCSNSSYKLAHKSECCASSPKTDTDCWTFKGTWTDQSSETYVNAGVGCHAVVRQNTCPDDAKSTLEAIYVFGSKSWDSPRPSCTNLNATCLLDAYGHISPDCYGEKITFICSGEYQKNGW